MRVKEDFISESAFEENKRWYKKMLKRPHRVTKLPEPQGDAILMYSIHIGDVWIGEGK